MQQRAACEMGELIDIKKRKQPKNDELHLCIEIENSREMSLLPQMGLLSARSFVVGIHVGIAVVIKTGV